MSRCRRLLAIPALLVALLPLPAHAGAVGADEAAGPAVLAHAFSPADLVRTARGVGVGQALRVEGLALGPVGPLDQPARPEALDLVRFEVFTPDARIVVHGEDGARRVPVPDNRYFRGGVVGDPDSLALLTVRAAGGVRGIVRRGGTVYVLGRETSDPAGPTGAGRLVGRALAGPSTDPSTEESRTDGFTCGADGLTPPEASAGDLLGSRAPGGAALDRPALEPRAQAASYSARVAVETDAEFLQLFAGVTDATDYVGDLLAYASSIYDAEIATELSLSHLSLWETSTSGDPWTQGNPGCALYEFGRFWNDNRTGVERSLAHFMSGKTSNAGIAWIGVLCRSGFLVDLGNACPDLSPRVDAYGGAYGYTGGLDGDFDPASPAPVWDIVAVSHEMGHNFDSPHTHCYNGLGGSSDPVDQCYGTQTGCYSGSTSLPCPSGNSGCGTIMSYCHFLSGGLSNVALTFGAGHPWGTLPQRVPDRMRAHADATAQASTCLDRIEPCTELVLENETVNDSRTYDCATVRAGNGYEIAAPGGDVTLIGESVVLENGFSIQDGARLVVETK